MLSLHEPNDEWTYVATIWVNFESGTEEPVVAVVPSSLEMAPGFYPCFVTNGRLMDYMFGL